MKYLIQTQRLNLRHICDADHDAIAAILQDREVMYAYEHAFSDSEVREWILRQYERYKQHGTGLLAVELRQTGQVIGQCGITLQDTPSGKVYEIGYLFAKQFWHRGFATEAARACKLYAFALGIKDVYSIIRDNNIPSQNVALRNGMKATGEFVKHYYGMDMRHIIYSYSFSGKE